jgi:hypothetical protein
VIPFICTLGLFFLVLALDAWGLLGDERGELYLLGILTLACLSLMVAA